MQLDDEDYSYIHECYDLKISEHGYVYCSPKRKFKGKMLLFSMTIHKLLMNPEKSGRNVVVDHRDGNKLNNQKENLRVCSHQENMQNRKTHKKIMENASIYKGVLWIEKLNMWMSHIKKTVEYRISIGCFTNEVAAANSYNYHALLYHGDFASLNDCPFMEKEEWESYCSKVNHTSIYRGVSWVENNWLVQIMHKGITYRVGSFKDEVKAAIAYNEKAIELKGKKARLNEILV